MTYDKMRKDYERMRDAEKTRIVDEWKAANGYNDLLAAYTMTDAGLAVFSAGVALPVPAADVPSVAALFLADGEALEIRPANAFRYARLIAYGVAAGRYRRLPIVVGAR